MHIEHIVHIAGILDNVRYSSFSPIKKETATLLWQMERIIASFTPQQTLHDMAMQSISLVIPLRRPIRHGSRNRGSAQIKVPRFS